MTATTTAPGYLDERGPDGRRKRAFAPAPTIDRTHLYEKPGPTAIVCIDRNLGYCIAMTPRGAIWSHGPDAVPTATRHPDWLRVAFAWPDLKSAKADMMSRSSLATWHRISFYAIRCDVAESPQRDERTSIDEMPLQYPSLEACHEATGLFEPLEHHRLDPKTRRARVERRAVSLGGRRPARAAPIE